MLKKTGDTSHLFGLSLFSKQKQELLTYLENEGLPGERLLIVFTPNPEQVVQMEEEPRLRDYFNQATHLLPDGVGLVLASRLLALRGKATPLSERIAGVEVVTDLLELSRDQNLRVLVVGGRDYSKTNTVMYQGQSLDWTPGYANALQPTPEEEAEIKSLIKALQPHIVLVAFGAPAQERWIIEHRDLLSQAQVKLAMAVGGSFDYLLGKVPRAPKWVRAVGLEWFSRLVLQPWRWKRQLRLIKFVGMTFKEFFS